MYIDNWGIEHDPDDAPPPPKYNMRSPTAKYNMRDMPITYNKL